MILSVSRRTDIPARHMDWLIRRFQEGYVLRENPYRRGRLTRIALNPDTVEAIVFWSKDPRPLLGHLDFFQDYPFSLQFTLNPYGPDIEPGIPRKKILVDTFRRLADRIGPDRVIWRYDPILLTETVTPAYHAKWFDYLAGELEGAAETCMISRLDLYGKLKGPAEQIGFRRPDDEDIRRILDPIREAAEHRGIAVRSCAEDLSTWDIPRGACIDKGLLERITGHALDLKKDGGQRPGCLCSEAVDIGAYNTCGQGCVYCYADRVRGPGPKDGDPASPLLGRTLRPDDEIREKPVKSHIAPAAPLEFGF